MRGKTTSIQQSPQGPFAFHCGLLLPGRLGIVGRNCFLPSTVLRVRPRPASTKLSHCLENHKDAIHKFGLKLGGDKDGCIERTSEKDMIS